MAKSKPFDSARGFISETPGKTDGKFGIGVSGQSTKLHRKRPKVSKRLYFEESIIDELPSDAMVRITKSGKIDMVITYQKPEPKKKKETKKGPAPITPTTFSFTFRTKR